MSRVPGLFVLCLISVCICVCGIFITFVNYLHIAASTDVFKTIMCYTNISALSRNGVCGVFLCEEDQH